ncbi:MAG TPA: Gfo/Idh/MocA family oxidoreductase [Pirellulales bacterium]|nr:Gfo/Idh/MocA family oxidoreductase [Pirellulales bacterium]
MSNVVGIGVIGMGWMGMVHSRSYRMIADRFHESGIRARLVICADDVEARAREAQERLGFEESTTDWKRVVAHPEVQVVNVTSPNHMHLEMIRGATAAGKHVFCEKPVGRDSRETGAIAQLARQAGVLSWVGYNYRWVPVVQYARQMIRSGKLGALTHYRGRFLVDYGSNPDGVLSWRFQRELAGHGTLGDLMSHVADMAHMLAGPIRRVVANQKTFIASRPVATPGLGTHFSVNPAAPRAPVTNEDYVGALVEFTSGAQGSLEVCRVVKGPRCEMAFELNGTRGAVKWNFERMNELQVFLPDGTEAHDGPVLIQGGPAHPFYKSFYPGPALSMSYEDLKVIEAFQFLRSVVDGVQGEPGFAEALDVAAVQDAIERSWASERWEHVRLPDGSAA